MLFQLLNNIVLDNANLLFVEDFFNKKEADRLLQSLTETTPWEQGEITMFGKKILEPRLSSWHGDAGKVYTYSGKTQNPLPWTETLAFIKNKIVKQTFDAQATPSVFNSVLANFYRNGQDSMGFHADDEKELGKNPTIASVNFGETRRFIFRRKDDKTTKHELLLTHGSLLIMSGEMQHFWQHAVPKEPNKTKPRINLTYRNIL